MLGMGFHSFSLYLKRPKSWFLNHILQTENKKIEFFRSRLASNFVILSNSSNNIPYVWCAVKIPHNGRKWQSWLCDRLPHFDTFKWMCSDQCTAWHDRPAVRKLAHVITVFEITYCFVKFFLWTFLLFQSVLAEKGNLHWYILFLF